MSILSTAGTRSVPQPLKPSSLVDDVPHEAEPRREVRTGSKSKKTAVAVALCVLSFATLAFVGLRAYRSHAGSPGAQSRSRTLIDSETGKVFEDFAISANETVPFKNPSTGRNTLYPAEACYWTKDGKATLQPTWVLLNEVAGKPGPTKCPDCGRIVTPHNRKPPVELMIEAAERQSKK